MNIDPVGLRTMSTPLAVPRGTATAGKGIDTSSQLYKTCQDFESIFVKQMLNSMKSTINKNELINGGMAEDIFSDMLYDEYAKAITSTSHLGIADMMYQQLKDSQ